jgi:hypothetical protein
MQKEQDSTVFNVQRAESVDESYPAGLRELEEQRIEQRRVAAFGEDGARQRSSTPPVGVAISGGGIRSATFALGVFHVLAREKLVRCIDVLSTVSGGGYFGGFLGRLFTRDFVVPLARPGPARPHSPTERPVDRVEAALSNQEGNFHYDEVEEKVEKQDQASVGGGPTTISKRGPLEQLRNNGRYLAPKGGGDLLVAASVLFRNWVSLHAVILATLVTLFLAPRIVDGVPAVQRWIGWCSDAIEHGTNQSPAPLSLVLGLQGAMLYLVAAGGVFLLCLLPRMWGYWLLGGAGARKGQAPRQIDVLTTVPLFVAIVASGVVVLATKDAGWSAAPVVSAAVGLEALLAMATALWAKARAKKLSEKDPLRLSRAWVSRGLVRALVVVTALLVAAIVGALGNWIWGNGGVAAAKRLLAALGGTATLAAFGKQIVVNFGNPKRDQRPGLPLSVVAYVAAAAWVLVLLLTADVLSRATAGTATWGDAASSVPQDWLGKNFGWIRPAGALLLGAILCFLLGRHVPFLNLSSQSNMYAQRLTRAYLGGSNPLRIKRRVSLTDAIDSDDVRLDHYWRTDRGAPLHFINTTINETLDGTTAVQFLDRKGLPLVLGPNGLTAGKRHHYVTDWRKHFDDPAPSRGPGAAAGAETTAFAPPPSPTAQNTRGDYAVFAEGFDPEILTIGQWVAISGAAFSTGLGAQTNLGMSLLCGLANVRLGYWWNSNLDRERLSPRMRRITSAFPVQTYLVNELLARFPGTAWRRWYLTDGGHFENMGGYELIRRKLPLMVIVDGEADGDYGFEGLGNLVRLARVDFDTDVRFLTEVELDRLIAPKHRRAFGSLDHLRRGNWEDLEPTGEPECGRGRAKLEEPDPAKHSLAHAALARVTYPGRKRGWLVYLKTTLTGREPTDVTHYHRVHEDFPHEPTSDQFFDEMQWESYRKLGEHVAEQVFGKGEDFDRVAERDRPPGPKDDEGKPVDGWSPRDLFAGEVGPLDALDVGDEKKKA